jgi:solute:Na+ symporter, SSS family
VFFASLLLAAAVSLARPAPAADNQITTGDVRFVTPPSFNIGAIGVILILIVFYATWW